MKYLITGSSGFIGYNLSELLLKLGEQVIGIDNQNDYYDVRLKIQREERLAKKKKYTFHLADICDEIEVNRIIRSNKPDVIIHLAAQAGVRNSIYNPEQYFDSNLIGTYKVLNLARTHNISHLLMASTSSVYGANKNMPFSEDANTDFPLSFYAATKKATEVMAHSYSHIYNIPITVFRFFTVYGPWGRPDMALFKFTKAILNGKPIDVYNNGNMKRDFTFIDDLCKAIQLLSREKPFPNQLSSASSQVAPYRVINIGNGKPENLMDFVRLIEKKLGLTAKINFLEMQQGDVPETFARNYELKNLTGFTPSTNIKEGISKFVDWYLEYYH